MTFSRTSIEENPEYKKIRKLIYAFYGVHYTFISLDKVSRELISLVFDPASVMATKEDDPLNQQLSLILKDPTYRHFAVYAILDLYITLFEKMYPPTLMYLIFISSMDNSNKFLA